mmetsp:Transcript_32925/g.83413  ORF Transcript_32925/g.83413 Transcript_32925/m.83413 type:complete len:147 (+) Transcript_32925:91-531(+)
MGNAPCCAGEETKAEVVSLVVTDENVPAKQETPPAIFEPLQEEKKADGDGLIGEWATSKGQYSISRDASGQLIFLETSTPPLVLTGVLSDRGEWWEAEIRDTANNNALFGWLRAKTEGAGIRTSFRKQATSKWDPEGLWATRQMGK